MRILLVNPALDERETRLFKKIKPAMAPLGLAYLAAVLEQDGFEVSVVDQYNSGTSNFELVNGIKQLKTKIIGISCLTVAMESVKKLCSHIKNADPEVCIVLGNIHPTAFTDTIAGEIEADVVVSGEGEETMLEVARAVRENNKFNQIKGISYLKHGKVVNNPGRELIGNINTLPFPAWHLFNLSLYRNCTSIGVSNKTMLPVLGSRGCRNNCVFCCHSKIYPGLRIREVANIVDEIEYLYRNLKVDNFLFVDPCFPFSIESGMEFCKEMKRRGLNNKVSWYTETRVDEVTPLLLQTMRSAGLKTINFGFESGNQRVLNKTGKKTTLKQARQAVEWCRWAGLRITGFFMLGLPEDTVESCIQTIKFAKKLDPDLAQFNITTPYPGTSLYEKLKRENKLPEGFSGYSAWNELSPVSGAMTYSPENISVQKLQFLQQRAMLEFYLRPKKIIRLINMLSVKFIVSGFLLLVFFALRGMCYKLRSFIKPTG